MFSVSLIKLTRSHYHSIGTESYFGVVNLGVVSEVEFGDPSMRSLYLIEESFIIFSTFFECALCPPRTYTFCSNKGSKTTLLSPKSKMSHITVEDAEAVINIAQKCSSEQAILPETTRAGLILALEKLKMQFQTPAEATMELFEGVCDFTRICGYLH
jgi:hypothetical protein